MGFWRSEPGTIYPPWIAERAANLYTPVLRYYSSSSSTARPSLWALRDYYSDSAGTWVIAESPVPSIRIGSNLLSIQSMTYSRAPWFSDGSNVLFYSAARWAWIYREAESEPAEPRAAIGLDDETWTGDAWYARGGSPDFSQFPLTFEPAGTLLNGSASSLVATMEWPRWIRQADRLSPEPCGVYAAESGSGLSPATRAIGLPVWRGQIAGRTRFFRRSYAKSSSRYSYGDIAWKSARSAYVLGEIGATGWYESAAAPTIAGGATLVHMSLDEEGAPVADGADPVALSFDHYEFGDEAEAGYITEVVTWRP